MISKQSKVPFGAAILELCLVDYPFFFQLLLSWIDAIMDGWTCPAHNRHNCLFAPA